MSGAVPLGTKAETLQALAGRLRRATIEPLVVLRVDEWRRSRADCCARVRARFADARLVVRSSAAAEDTAQTSNAGRFTSIVDVTAEDEARFAAAVDAVIASYGGDRAGAHEQILVQSLTRGVRCAGVVLTRQIETNAPYYVINYSAERDNTTAVTSGRENETLVLSRFIARPVEEPWEGLLTAIDEIESLTGLDRLDIEFAIREDGGVVIFQVRPIAVAPAASLADDVYRRLLETAIARFERFASPLPHLGGSTTILGDMPDWNPAEIIGDRPHSLAYTIYRYVITDETWHQARSALGYYDVAPAELMVSIGRKPYIDVRASFNSLTPASISPELRHKLVDHYLDRLREDPSRQDKVEFEIVWSSVDFMLRDDLERLPASFTPAERAALADGLTELTRGVFARFAEIRRAADEANARLAHRRAQVHASLRDDLPAWQVFRAAHILLDHCRLYGTYHFSILARLAFISRRIFLSLVRRGLIERSRLQAFFGSIDTVATDFCRDLDRLRRGALGEEDFLRHYGHLRPGAYDITAPRYDAPELRALLKSGPAPAAIAPAAFAFTPAETAAIARALAETDLGIDPAQLIAFHVAATQGRERLKFEFSRNLSDALELIARTGKTLGLSREIMAEIDLRTIFRYRNPAASTDAALAREIERVVGERERARNEYLNVILPPLITASRDFYYIRSYVPRPTFITDRHVVGGCVAADSAAELLRQEIDGRIVLIESADPGYDWIFARRPLALITCFGGAASHMAIRCAEFHLPAAIGVGRRLFDELRGAFAASLDCSLGVIKPTAPEE